MRLAVSNIAWPEAQDDLALSMLAGHGVDGVEVAPTRLWPNWSGMSLSSAREAKQRLRQRGFAVPAMQSLLFGRAELALFGESARRDALACHLEALFPIARELGARALVFGSPKNRDRGDLDERAAFAVAVDFFRKVAISANQHDVVLCIEPNPPQYGANFVTGWREALTLVQAVGTSGFGLHLDSGCIHMNGDDPCVAIRTCGAAIEHFHVSEPHLAGFASPLVDHAGVARALADIGYRNWISIEMRSTEASMPALETALRFVQGVYFDIKEVP
jgi:D-psicose/D-tagatose/L-ribulose 3-epimerase